jgi:hypothetical protein
VQHFNPNMSHPSIVGALVDEDGSVGADPVTGEFPAVGARARAGAGAEAEESGHSGAHAAADPDGDADTGETEATTRTDRPVAGAVDPVFTPEILDQYAPLGQAAPGASAATGTTAPSMPVPPVVSAEGDAAGTGPADPGAAVSPNWRIEERDNVRLSVQDHGVGIPARDLDRIFERFYRVDHGRSRDTGGTGLGLSIVRHVANNHQGWVDVESREGEGSTFTLVLPIQAERLA